MTEHHHSPFAPIRGSPVALIPAADVRAILLTASCSQPLVRRVVPRYADSAARRYPSSDAERPSETAPARICAQGRRPRFQLSSPNNLHPALLITGYFICWHLAVGRGRHLPVTPERGRHSNVVEYLRRLQHLRILSSAWKRGSYKTSSRAAGLGGLVVVWFTGQDGEHGLSGRPARSIGESPGCKPRVLTFSFTRIVERNCQP